MSRKRYFDFGRPGFLFYGPSRIYSFAEGVSDPADPGSGASGGGGGGTDPATPPVRTFTQAEVNKMIASDRRKLQAELTTAQSKIAELQQKMDELAAQGSSGSANGADAGQLEILRGRYERQTTELQNQIKKLEADVTSERSARREIERDRMVTEALSKVGCIDMTAGLRYFLPQIIFDDEEQKWQLRTKNGNLVDIADGIAEEMPNFLKPASMQNGGSGSRASSPKAQQIRRDLDKARQVLEEIKKKATQTGARQGDLVDYERQKRMVAQLEAQAASIK